MRIHLFGQGDHVQLQNEFWQILAYESNNNAPLNFGIASDYETALEQSNRLARHGLFTRIDLLRLNSVKSVSTHK